MGTIASISGALVVVLYKGPKVFSSQPWKSSSVLHEWPLESAESDWVIGGQNQPGSAGGISAPVCLIAEPDLISWRLSSSVAVIAVLYAGVLSSFGSIVIIWSLHLKEPVYIAAFNPLSIAIAAFLSAIFLGDSLHMGSIIGAVITSMGFYAVIWGKA